MRKKEKGEELISRVARLERIADFQSQTSPKIRDGSIVQFHLAVVINHRGVSTDRDGLEYSRVG